MPHTLTELLNTARPNWKSATQHRLGWSSNTFRWHFEKSGFANPDIASALVSLLEDTANAADQAIELLALPQMPPKPIAPAKQRPMSMHDLKALARRLRPDWDMKFGLPWNVSEHLRENGYTLIEGVGWFPPKPKD